jgi:hypothetical protein
MGQGECRWWFCDSFTGTSLGTFGHIAWHMRASAFTHAMMVVYFSSLALLFAVGAPVFATTAIVTCVLNAAALGPHTGAATWCALAGASSFTTFARHLWRRRALVETPRDTRDE